MKSNQWSLEQGNKPPAILAPPPVTTKASLKKSRGGDVPPPPLAPPPQPKARPGPKTAEHQRDVLQVAGIDLHEEAHALLSVSAVQSRNPFRGESEPLFCSPDALRKIMTDFSAKARVQFGQDVETLLSIAIERRMMQLLQRLADASQASVDGGRHGEFGPTWISSNPMAELKQFAAKEETLQAKKVKRQQEEVAKLMESGSNDERVKNLLEEQARYRAAAASNEAALAMARGGSSSSAAVAPSSGSKRALSSANKAIEDPPEIRIVRAKIEEGVATQEDVKTMEDWSRRNAAVQRGQSRLQRVKPGSERRIGLRDLLFVLEADPSFKNQKVSPSFLFYL